MPIAASRNATSAKPASTRTCTVRPTRSPRSMMSTIGRTFVIGCCGSMARMIDRTAGTSWLERRRRADDQVLRRIPPEPAVPHLPVRQVDLRLAVALEPAHANVADDADDRAIVSGEVELPAEGVLAGPVPLHEATR